MRALAVQECCAALLTSCQRISAQWFSAWLRGPQAHRALLAVKPEPCARLDRVTVVKNAAKVQWLHSARLTFTHSLLPKYPHRTKQNHTVCHSVHFTKSTYTTTCTNTKKIPGIIPVQDGMKTPFLSALFQAPLVTTTLLVAPIRIGCSLPTLLLSTVAMISQLIY